MSDKCQASFLCKWESLCTFAIKIAKYEEISISNDVGFHGSYDICICT